MAWWTKTTKRQRGSVKAHEAKEVGRFALRREDDVRIKEGLDEVERD